jgi:hypothetical protein
MKFIKLLVRLFKRNKPVFGQYQHDAKLAQSYLGAFNGRKPFGARSNTTL